MIKMFLPAICLISLCAIHTTAQKIVVNKGLKLSSVASVKTTMHIEAMGQTMNMESNVYTDAEAKSVSDTGYVFENKTTRFTMNSDAMGQSIHFDSDKQEDMNGPMGSAISKLIGAPQVFGINKYGKITSVTGMENITETAFANLATQLGKGQPYPFIISLPGRTVKEGDTWIDSTGNNDSLKYIFTYTLKGNSGDHSLVGIKALMKTVTTIKQQGMDIDINLQGTVTGDAVFEKNTGILESNNSVTEMKGTIGVMGQTVPLAMVANSTITVKKP